MIVIYFSDDVFLVIGFITVVIVFWDENIFAIFTHTWYADIVSYLATGKISQHLPYIKQGNIIHHSAHYSWIEGYLFYTRHDQQIQHEIGEDDIDEVVNVGNNTGRGGESVFTNQ